MVANLFSPKGHFDINNIISGLYKNYVLSVRDGKVEGATVYLPFFFSLVFHDCVTFLYNYCSRY